MTHTNRTASTTAAKTASLGKGLTLLTMAALTLLVGCGDARRASTAEPIVANDSEISSSDVSSAEISSTAGEPSRQALSTSLTPETPHAEDLYAQAPAENTAPTREYGLRPLSENELDEYRDHTLSLLTDHSFHLTYSDIGEADFVAAVSNESSLRDLRLYLSPQAGGFYALPAHHEGYYMSELKAVSFQELSDDDPSPDIIVIAEYITGIGPTGNEPFPVTTVYNYEGDGVYSKDEYVSELLTIHGVETIADAVEMIDELDED